VTRALAIAELTLRIERETEHARRAMAALGRCGHRERAPRSGGSGRASSYHWRRARRHMRAAARARAQLAATLPAPAGACEAHTRDVYTYLRGLSFGASVALAALGGAP